MRRRHHDRRPRHAGPGGSQATLRRHGRGGTRTDLASSVLAEGTLGYTASPPVVNQLGGTYTNVLAAGTVVQPGQALFTVDDKPVVLLSGGVPAWRPFAPGMTDGPDVQELETALIALGNAHDLFTAAGPHYGPAAVAAVERWQTALGEPRRERSRSAQSCSPRPRCASTPPPSHRVSPPRRATCRTG